MKNRTTGKQPADHQDHRGQAQHAAPAPIDDAVLRNYLADNLPPSDLARVEQVLRDSAQLRAQLEEVRNNREDVQLHSFGTIWHRGRLNLAPAASSSAVTCWTPLIPSWPRT